MPACVSTLQPALARRLFCLLVCLIGVLSAGVAGAQTAGAPTVPAIAGKTSADTRPKNFYLLIFGYEMDKARADSILQTQDMGKDVAVVVEKLDGLTRSKGATRVSNAATPLMSGVRCALNTEAFAIDATGYVAADADKIDLKMNRTAKAGGTTSAISANLDTQGTPFFIGTVPDVSKGKDQLLFMRCVVHYLD